MRKVKISAVQMSCTDNASENILKAEKLIRKASSEGSNIVLLPELFERQYFCQERKYEYYNFAKPINKNDAVIHFKKIAKELSIVVIVSFYEKDNNKFFNTVAVIDADGEILGKYRKCHIPDDHFYQEKFYFTPGDTGFVTFKTKFCTIGVGICWDQWFPEVARALALNGAEIIFYPTAIGSEPILDCDSMPHWKRTIQGHSAANIIPVAVANRVGKEDVIPCEENAKQKSSLVFYGSSFITDETGEIKAELSNQDEAVITREFDLDGIYQKRISWGLFRDRRPEQYKILSEK